MRRNVRKALLVQLPPVESINKQAHGALQRIRATSKAPRFSRQTAPGHDATRNDPLLPSRYPIFPGRPDTDRHDTKPRHLLRTRHARKYPFTFRAFSTTACLASGVRFQTTAHPNMQRVARSTTIRMETTFFISEKREQFIHCSLFHVSRNGGSKRACA